MGGQKPWTEIPVGNKDHTRAAVVIVGAGVSGMCMAIDLIKRNKCHKFIILEKSTSVGGTWYDNKYPGCCCDTYSLLYSYSFAQNPDWTRQYPNQEEFLEYLRNVANEYQLYRYIRFNTSVEAATWDDSNQCWKVDVKVTGGKSAEFSPGYTIESDFLITAVGHLNQPSYPEIPGICEFKGKIVHSARWDWTYDTSGKSIGIIGNGATTAQIAPEILPSCRSLTIYQRTPNWVTPRGDAPTSGLRRAIYRYLPPVRWRIRAALMDHQDGLKFDAITNVNSANTQALRKSCLDMMQEQIPGRPDLWEKLTPKYEPGCKRVIISDAYYRAVADCKTTLETEKIRRITEHGIELENGQEHNHDMIVLATGFRTLDFLSPIQINGTHGRPLRDIWHDGPSTLYGTTVPSLPNFGMVFGPNTALGHNSIILMIEAQTRYLTTLVSAVLDARNRNTRLSLMPKQSVTNEFNAKLQSLLGKTSFADPNCRSWYKTADGKIITNWYGTVVEYQKVLSKVDWADFKTTDSDEGKKDASEVVFGTGKKESRIGRVCEETFFSDTTLALGVVSTLMVGMALWRRVKQGR